MHLVVKALLSSSLNLFFNKSFILASGHCFPGQWKPFCFNFSNIYSIGGNLFISLKYNLNESFITASGNGFSVKWKRYSFIYILFWKRSCNYWEANIKKKSYICSWKVFSFSRHWFEWKQFFGTLKLYFSTNASFWVVEMNHRLITNLVLLSRAFFCWWTPFLKLGVYQFSSIFSVLNSGSSFSGWWKQIFYKILRSWERKRIFLPSVLLFKANFVLLETIIKIKVKAIW